MLITVNGTYDLIPNASWIDIPTEEIRLVCNTATNPVVINLPEISSIEGKTLNVKIYISDGANNAAANNIVINAGGSDKIGAATSYIINQNNASAYIQIANPTNWIATSNMSSGGGGSSPFQYSSTNSIKPVLGGNLADLTTFSTVAGGYKNIILDSNSAGYGFIGSGRCNSMQVSKASSVTSGYKNTIASSENSFIGSGCLNEISDSGYGKSSIVGGLQNRIDCSIESFIGGGKQNAICSYSQTSAVVAGFKNTIINTLGARGADIIGGGYCNSISLSLYGASAILGGYKNFMNCSQYSIIVGGRCNIMQHPTEIDASFIGGGFFNSICAGFDNSIVGGRNNSMTDNSYQNFIGGGKFNTISCSQYSMIGGGNYNSMSSSSLAGNYSNFIGGGICNTISGRAVESVIVGGCNNIIDSQGGGYGDNFIGGGFYNKVCSTTSVSFSSAVSGSYNTVSVDHSAILGGECNSISGSYGRSSIGGGSSNTIIFADNDFIAGGECNTINCSTGNSFIGAGFGNVVRNNSPCSSIGGGYGNILDYSEGSFIGGGKSNTMIRISAGDQKSFIGAGYNNSIFESEKSSIVGGANNSLCSSSYSGIFGGMCNSVSSYCKTFIIGSNITADADCTTYVNKLSIKDIPTSSVGLSAGSVWNDLGTLKIV